MSEIRINRMRLRIPGLPPAQARALAEATARRVMEGLPQAGGKGRLGLLALRVSVPRGSSREQIESAVAKSILRGLVR